MIARIKKITVYLFSATLTISLIAGYFCSMPQMAQAASVSVTMPDMSFSDCQGAIIFSDYMISSATPSHAIAPCCLEKNDHNSQSGAINFNNFSFGDTGSRSISTVQIANNDSANCAVVFDYPI